MGKRVDLHKILCDIMQKVTGSACVHVYYNPPEKLKLEYPCIIYHKSEIRLSHADDMGYLSKNGYMATVIDYGPDSPIGDEILKLPLSSFSRTYVAENLYHSIYKLFY